jgi:hypothetical protein
MRWSNPDNELDQETKEALNKANWVAIPLGVVIYGILGFFVHQNSQREDARFLAQRLRYVVAAKYIRGAGYPTLTIVLRDAQREFTSSPSIKNYEFLQRGDSLYKPAGSATFYARRDSSGYRIWKMLPEAL